VKKIIQAEKGFSTLGARRIWYDDTVMRINTDERGRYLGAFKEDDRILTITNTGFYRLMTFDLSNHFDEDMIIIEKFVPTRPVTAIYYNPLKNTWFAKRFMLEVTDKKASFLPEEVGIKLEKVITQYRPVLQVEFNNEGLKKPVETPQVFEMDSFVELMGVKARGKRLGMAPIDSLEWLEPLPYDDEIPEEIDEDEPQVDEPSEEELADMPEEIPHIDESSIKPPPDFPDDDDDGTPVQMTLF